MLDLTVASSTAGTARARPAVLTRVESTGGGAGARPQCTLAEYAVYER
ncbi:MAG TPA: hypothetical protein VHF24_06080 [Acidimicrobiales bacterium]|nr:hypothetical protein [Acidimicrobiales bacterium]